jgi:hypothetical protein
VHILAIILFSACKYNRKVFSVVSNRNCGTGPYAPDEVWPSLRAIEPDGGCTTAAPMRWMSNAVWRDWIDHGYLPKVLVLKMTSLPEAARIAGRLVDGGWMTSRAMLCTKLSDELVNE